MRAAVKIPRIVVGIVIALALTTVVLHGMAAPRQESAPTHTGGPINFSKYVDPLIGTAGDGNVTPAASAPFGMVQWGPDTSAGGLSKPGGYNYGDTIIRGFSLTHLSGAGCAAFENFPIMPTTKSIIQEPQSNGSPYSSRFRHAQETASAGQYAVLLASGIAVHLIATPHAGAATLRYPAHSRASVVLDAGGGAGISNTSGMLTSQVEITGNRSLSGSATGGNFCGLHNRYRIYFAAEFDRPFEHYGVWQGGRLRAGSRRARGSRAGAWLTFDPSARTDVRMKIGLSYVSTRAARTNLKAEIPAWNFAHVESETRRRWSGVLGRIKAAGAFPADTVRFYSALYRCFLHPNVFSDVDGHYMGFDQRVHVARGYTQYANFSGWDIYRSWVQLAAWLLPHETSDMMQSLVADARQGGTLPKWPVANQDTGEMNGDSADPILAGAWAFGARGFDAHGALLAMTRGASQPGLGPAGALERPGLNDYLRLGYVRPQNGGWGAAATTLEYAVDDFAIAQLARSLHDQRSYRIFLRHARNWRHLYNPNTGFLQQRLSNGRFDPAFRPASMDGFVEGDAYQYLWMTPHDLHHLLAAIGTDRAVTGRLNKLFTQLNAGPVAPYYWAGNEPGLEIPWEYDWTRSPWRAQDIVARIMRTQYPASPHGLPGNDDLGAMSSWYVWSALGLYPEIPGVGGFALGRPHFQTITVYLPRGYKFRIQTSRAKASGKYVRAAYLDGRALTRPWLPLSSLKTNSTLHFVLSKSRAAWSGSRSVGMP